MTAISLHLLRHVVDFLLEHHFDFTENSDDLIKVFFGDAMTHRLDIGVPASCGALFEPPVTVEGVVRNFMQVGKRWVSRSGGEGSDRLDFRNAR